MNSIEQHQHQHKYLVTTNADTGEVVRVERLGTTGELVEVPADTLPGLVATAPPAPTPVDEGGPEHAPGVFLESSMRDLDDGPESSPGVFVESNLRDLDDGPEHAPGIFV